MSTGSVREHATVVAGRLMNNQHATAIAGRYINNQHATAVAAPKTAS